MVKDLSIFKDYDVRGICPDQLNPSIVKEIAHAIVRKFQPKSIAMCRDMRLYGKELRNAFVEVFLSLGVDVYDAGIVGTEIQYFIAGTRDYDLVIMISASHNPPEYNGFKMVKKGPIAVTSESGMYEVRDLIKVGPVPIASKPGNLTMIDVWKEWKDKILSLVDVSSFKPMKVVVDGGNGMAGTIISTIFKDLPFTVIPLYFEQDGTFPNHTPNPLIEKNNEVLQKTILSENADVGLTFDGDADRMFLIDDKGRFVSGTITTALLSEYILKKHPRELILYNAICGRIVAQIIEKLGGVSKRVRVGHSYIKTYMRETNALFAGEHSGHYYYRDFFAAESGVLTALLVLSLLSQSTKSLSTLVDELNLYPASSEINFTVKDIPVIVEKIKSGYTDATSKDEIDGISVWYPTYWFNVRASKTEPVIRLNIEADTKEILESKTKELMQFIQSMGGVIK